MSEKLFTVQGRDVLLFRDGRPFANEPGAYSALTLPLPLPGTLAGMLRTRYGDQHQNWDWTDTEKQEEAKRLIVHGPILLRNDKPVFRAPADAVVYIDPDRRKADPEHCKPTVMPLRPYCGAGKTDLSETEGGLTPLVVIGTEVKPESGYNYWKWCDLMAWLQTDPTASFPPPEKIPGPLREERTHVAINEKTGTSAEGMLFTAQFLAFEEYPRRYAAVREDEQTQQASWQLLTRVATDSDLSGMTPFGGERRLAVIAGSNVWPHCPEDLAKALQDNGRGGVRMMLATPAIFDGGWKPGWLDQNLEGTPPGTSVRLRLKSAATLRREPVSGWDYRIKQRGPKPVRWMVPAGSVYFFEVVAGNPATLAHDGWPKPADENAQASDEGGWLKPVSDNVQDCNDGYGLALWGLWSATGDSIP